jgi:hypothetical protein
MEVMLEPTHTVLITLRLMTEKVLKLFTEEVVHLFLFIIAFDVAVYLFKLSDLVHKFASFHKKMFI